MRLSFICSSLLLLLQQVDAQGSTLSSAGRNATIGHSASSQPSSGSHMPVDAQQNDVTAQNVSLYDKLPGLWFETCMDDEGTLPCTAYCHKTDARCQRLGRAAADGCNNLWTTYNAERLQSTDLAPGWSTVYSTYGQNDTLSSTTVDVYTTFSTAKEAVVKQNVHTNAADRMVTITPVYALGRPTPSVSVTTVSTWVVTNHWLTKPTPSCRYVAMMTNSNCGQCSIYGGSVVLYFWPPTTSTDAGSASVTERSMVLTEGVTLYSPTVYISLSTIYASNTCSRVGQNHTGTLLAMNPTDVSTQYHFGGKVAASGANHYNRINYADLTGLPPVSAYEVQPSCIMFGCSTILPTFNPTLVVPLALRTLRPEWADCGQALDGLYDPPVALTEQAAMASPTLPSGNGAGHLTPTSTSTYSSASQCSSPSASTPTQTGGLKPTESAQEPDAVSELASLIAGTEAPSHNPTSPSSVLPHPSSDALEEASSSDPRNKSTPDHQTAQDVSTSGLPVSAWKIETYSSSEGTTNVGRYIATLMSLIQQDTASGASDPGSEIPQTTSFTNPPLSTPLAEQSGTSTENEPSATSPLPSSDVSSPHESLHPHHAPKVHQNAQGDFIVNGKTLAPGSPITLSKGASPMTVKMVTSEGKTLIELGTTRTALLGSSRSSSEPTASNSSRIDTSRSTALPSLVLSDPTVLTSAMEASSPSTSSISAASHFMRPLGIWATVLINIIVCLVMP